MAGGHCMTVQDHEGDAFRIVNSWGEDWGAGGRCVFSADMLAWGASEDFWIVDRSPVDFE
jgi:C1A family cysteine protease